MTLTPSIIYQTDRLLLLYLQYEIRFNRGLSFRVILNFLRRGETGVKPVRFWGGDLPGVNSYQLLAYLRVIV